MSRLSLLSQDTTNDLVVNIGDTPNDKTGDPLRTAFNKIKNSISRSDDNFVELYSITSSIPEDISDLTDTNNLLSGSSSVESLNDLNDISYSVLSIQDGQLLRWNSLESRFTAGSVSWEDITMTPAIPEDIGDLTDTGGLLSTSELVSSTVPTIGSLASAGEDGITYSNQIAIFTEGAFTIGVWTDVQVGWTVTDNNGFTDTIASRGGFGAASFVTTTNNWPAPASGKTYVFTSPDYQAGYTNPIVITVGDKDWNFVADGNLTVPGGISSAEHLFLDANYDEGYSVYIGGNHPTAGTLGGVAIGDSRGGFVEFVTEKLYIRNTAVPTSSIGSNGDYAGLVAVDNDYIYRCVANYDGVSNIWKRVGLDATPW